MGDGDNRMAENIRIDDLADPQLTDFQKMAINAVKDIKVEFSENAVLSAARSNTGLEDFGPDDFRERLAIWAARKLG